MSCKKCGSPFHEQWVCTKSTAARMDVPVIQRLGSAPPPAIRSKGDGNQGNAARQIRQEAGSDHPGGSAEGSKLGGQAPIAGTQAPPVDTKIVGKRRGRPQTITDMKAYRAAKAVEYRARKKADER